MSFEIRTILPEDNTALAKIIRDTLTEFGANKPGTVYFDDATDHLSDVFKAEGSIYYVAMEEGVIVGGAGIYPTKGLPEGVCELVKMYLVPSARGKGYARQLMDLCFEFAKSKGYKQIYLESMPELTTAVGIYEKMGFTHRNEPMGDSGHFGCEIRMIKAL